MNSVVFALNHTFVSGREAI